MASSRLRLGEVHPHLYPIAMTTEEIKNSLRQLHAELAQGHAVDPEVSSLLIVLDKDIHSLLNQPTAAAAHAHPIAERLDAAALQLEVGHPKLAPVLRQVGEALSRIGI